MKTKRSVFDWASLLSLLSVAALILLGIGCLIIEATVHGEISPPIPLVVSLVLVFTLGVIALWIEAWIWTVSGWNKRSTALNLALILFVLIGPVFAAYGIHFFARNRSNVLKEQ